VRQTLFYIQDQVQEIPVFGVGLLLVLWVVFSIGLIVWLARRQGMTADTLGYLPVITIVAIVIIFVLPGIVESGRGLPIRSYGVMTMLGIIAGVYLLAKRAVKAGIATEIIYSSSVWFCVAGFVGARLFHVIEYWDSSYRHTSADGSIDVLATGMAMINVPQGGLVVYGAFVGSALAFFWLIRRYKLPALAFADLIAPSLMLGLAIGRLGCLLNGCCFGGSCALPWSVTFPQSSPPYQRQMEAGLGMGLQVASKARPQDFSKTESKQNRTSPDHHARPIIRWLSPRLQKEGLAPGDEIIRIADINHPSPEQVWRALLSASAHGGLVSIETNHGQEALLSPLPAPPRSLPVHPTQIYSSISAFALCLFLLAYHPFRRRDGVVFGLLVTIYPVIRILLEIIRTDEAPQFGTGLSISQLVSLILLGLVVLYWIWVLRQPRGSLWKSPDKHPVG